MDGSSPVSPYGSAGDLPSVKQIEQLIAGLKLFDSRLSRDQRKQINDLEQEHHRIVETVDRFYKLLGERNWVFTNDLDLTSVTQVIDAGNTELAEKRILDYYKTGDNIASPLNRLRRFDAMQPRIELLQKALADYEAGRYYSTVLVLLSVMDGFVNDLDTAARQGLHARPADDMVAWDSVTGHHLGLRHAHQSFIKGFYKTDTTKVTDLFRNGIMHGSLVEFDNEIVATKAWNRLFAVSDWAEAKKQRASTTEASPSLEGEQRSMREAQERAVRTSEWQPYEYEPSNSDEDQPEVAATCADFLDRWQKLQWGPVGAHFLDTTQSSTGNLAVEAKDLYRLHELSSWKLFRVRHVAAALAYVDVELVVNGTTYQTDLRWVRIDEAGNVAMEWETGRWALAPYGPSLLLKG